MFSDNDISSVNINYTASIMTMVFSQTNTKIKIGVER